MSGQSQKKILIITQEIDPHADVMVVELRRRGADFIRWHADSFPLHSSVTLRLDEDIGGTIRLNGDALDLSDIRSVWYRRPAPFLLPPTLSEDEREFARGELRSAFHGLFRIADWFWVNHPDKIRVASSKALQLRVAREVGLLTPRTLITNDPEEVKSFFDECGGRIIYKTLNSPFFGGSGKGLLTTPISREHLDNVHLIRNAPGILQEYVPKRFELRITIIGRKVLAAEIHSQDHPQARDDWRAAEMEELPHFAHRLPRDIEQRCLRFSEHFGLAFSALDMILTPDGRYIFLENNPSGQFGWIEDLTGLPLTATLAEMLMAGEIL